MERKETGKTEKKKEREQFKKRNKQMEENLEKVYGRKAKYSKRKYLKAKKQEQKKD
jgi:hypothetical protein